MEIEVVLLYLEPKARSTPGQMCDKCSDILHGPSKYAFCSGVLRSLAQEHILRLRSSKARSWREFKISGLKWNGYEGVPVVMPISGSTIFVEQPVQSLENIQERILERLEVETWDFA